MPALRQDFGVLSSHPVCIQQKRESRTRGKTRVEKTCLCVDTVTTKRDTERQIFDGLWSHYCAQKGHPKLGTVNIPKVIPVDFYKTAKLPQEFDFLKKYY